MTELGVVLKVKDNFAQVRVGRNSACAACGKCGMTQKQKHVDFYASNEIGAKDGDTVELDIPEGNTAKLALFAYFVPLLPALALMFMAFGLQWSEWLAVVLFFGGLAVGFAILSIIDRVRRHKWMSTPTITKIVGRNSTEPVEQIQNEKQVEGENNNE